MGKPGQKYKVEFFMDSGVINETEGVSNPQDIKNAYKRALSGFGRWWRNGTYTLAGSTNTVMVDLRKVQIIQFTPQPEAPLPPLKEKSDE